MFKLLERICDILENLRIPYMLSGSVAMNFYADPRTTQDIDIVVEMQDYDVSSFVKMLDDKFYYFQEGIYEEIRRKGMFNIIDFESGFKVDFIVRKNDLYEQVKFQNRRKTLYFDIDLWIISQEDLIISKLQWIQVLESEKQKQDIINLLDSEQLDLEYIKNWCRTLRLKTYKLL
jgi:hypothetical protein